MKEKNKKVASGAAIFLLIRHEQFTLKCRDTMGVELLASPSTVAMLHPVCFCTIKDGWHVCLDLPREGVR
jgi:hypothetical protein